MSHNTSLEQAGFIPHGLDPAKAHVLWAGRLPEHLVLDAAAFQTLWLLHPEGYHLIKIHGRLVATPRWQQAFFVMPYATNLAWKHAVPRARQFQGRRISVTFRGLLSPS